MIKTIAKKILPHGIVTLVQKKQQEKIQAASELRFRTMLAEKLSQREIVCIELGAGDKRASEEWLTMDLNQASDIPFNLLNRLPFDDDSVDKIYSSHFLEHFHTKDILLILKECHRVLKPGGWISACVPDGSIYINAYTENTELDPGKWLRYTPAATIFSRIDVVNYMAYMDNEHKHLFDIENLCAIFGAGGFKNVRPRNFISGLDMQVRDYQSIYVEATK